MPSVFCTVLDTKGTWILCFGFMQWKKNIAKKCQLVNKMPSEYSPRGRGPVIQDDLQA